jgi:hypothetical protein
MKMNTDWKQSGVDDGVGVGVRVFVGVMVGVMDGVGVFVGVTDGVGVGSVSGR